MQSAATIDTTKYITALRSSRIRLSLTKAAIAFALLHCIEPIKHCSHRSPSTVTCEHIAFDTSLVFLQ